jgi:hypothetical protein
MTNGTGLCYGWRRPVALLAPGGWSAAGQRPAHALVRGPGLEHGLDEGPFLPQELQRGRGAPVGAPGAGTEGAAWRRQRAAWGQGTCA